MTITIGYLQGREGAREGGREGGRERGSDCDDDDDDSVVGSGKVYLEGESRSIVFRSILMSI